jgi:signal transduction histidine kinase/CheY-like chemotaxis protein
MALDVRSLLVDDEGLRRFEGAMAATGGARHMLQSRHRRRDGSIMHVEITSNGVEVAGRAARLALINDVTDRVLQEEALQRSEEKLRESQKMEAVGRLAGGIAHDFNNLLTAITGHAQLLLDEVDASLEPQIHEIANAANRAASLTHQLLAFSRKQVLQPVILDLNDAVRETESLLRRVIGEHIQLSLSLDSALRRVKADPAQMQQVLMNVVLNARDAMPNGGTLNIRTCNTTTSELPSNRPAEIPEGRFSMVVITDNGEGMDAHTLAHVFEPFFTTKAAGKGTGLGLATVYGILRQSDGYIFAESQPGGGTTFRVLLPVSDESPGLERQRSTTAEPRRSGGETILVVEDEESVRALVQKVLEKRGYNVLSAPNGAAALEIVGEGEPIDLLLTDIVMPGIPGQDLARRVAELRPGILVLFMSGYAEDAIAGRGMLGPDANFLEKPFTPSGLATIVRSVLDGE